MELNIYQSFLSLLRLGIGHEIGYLPTRINWSEVKEQADKQGLTAIVLDGIEKLSGKSKGLLSNFSKNLRLEWIGEVLQSYDQRYDAYIKAISTLAECYESYGFKMMVLKGYACSLDWPIPEHRPCGDIDIWQFGQWREADEVLSKEKGIKIDNSHHHHTVFNWQGFMVENHYDFVNVHHSKSNFHLERVFKELGTNDSYSVEVCGEKVYLPSPNLHALFLLRHAMIEFASSGINLRQLLDWAFFVKSNGKNIDWRWLEDILSEYGMKCLYSIFNAICVDDLGFDASLFPNAQFNPYLKDRVLNEILSPAIPNNKPKNMVSRLFWKWQRWKANEWKHELCYKESMWIAFWYGLWGHLLKPASI